MNKLIAPQASLHADHRRAVGIVVDRHRIGLFERYRRHPSGSLYLAGSGAFGEIEIHVCGRSQNSLMTFGGSEHRIGHIVPYQRHNRGRHIAPGDDFLPSYDRTSAVGHHARHRIGQPSLQLRSLRQPLALEQRLTVGTLLPAVVDSLVATYVDVL